MRNVEDDTVARLSSYARKTRARSFRVVAHTHTATKEAKHANASILLSKMQFITAASCVCVCVFVLRAFSLRM